MPLTNDTGTLETFMPFEQNPEEIPDVHLGVESDVPTITLRNGIVVLWDRLQCLNNSEEKPLALNSDIAIIDGEERYLTLRVDKVIAIIEHRPECSEYAVSFLRGEVCSDENFPDVATACHRILKVLRDQAIKRSTIFQEARRARMASRS
jgi:hypothetical protein